MDASRVLLALATGDVQPLLDELPWDARENLTMPSGDPAVLGRVGTYGVVWTDSAGLDVHEHENESDAIECHEGKLELFRQVVAEATFARMRPEIDRDLASLDNTYEGRHAAPDQGY